MAAVDEIAIKLGIKTGDLKAALLDANAQVKAFKKAGESTEDEGLMGQLKGIKNSFRNFKDLLAAGGIATAVVGFFRLAIDRAEELKGELNANAEAVRGFADGLKAAKDVAGNFAVLVIGTFNRLGEAIGETVNIVRSFITNGTQGFEVWARTQDAIANTARDAAIAEKNLADARKKNGAEFEAITKNLADLEKKSQEQKLKGITNDETQLNLIGRMWELQAKLRDSETSAIEKRRTQLEIAKTQLALDEVTLSVKKEEAAATKKNTEEMEKQWETARKEAADLAKRKALSQEQEIEIFVLQQKNAATLTKADRDRLAVLMLQREEKAKQVQIEDLLQKKITEGLSPEETKVLGELLKQTTELQKQIIAKQLLANVATTVQLPSEEAVTEELRKQKAIKDAMAKKTQEEALAAYYKTSTQVVGDVLSLSDIQLSALLAKLTPKFEDVKRLDDIYAGVGATLGLTKSFEQSMLKNNIDAVKREQDARRAFEQTVKMLGLQYAERTFSPDEFARLSQLINPDIAKKQANSIDRVDRTLTNLFPKQAAGIPVNN